MDRWIYLFWTQVMKCAIALFIISHNQAIVKLFGYCFTILIILKEILRALLLSFTDLSTLNKELMLSHNLNSLVDVL